MTEVKSPKYNLEICESVVASPDAIGMWQSLMPSYIGIKKAENNTLCHSGESQNPDPPSSSPLDSPPQADWNDSFNFGLYFRSRKG